MLIFLCFKLALAVGIEPTKGMPLQTLQARRAWIALPFRFLNCFCNERQAAREFHDMQACIAIVLTCSFVPSKGPRTWLGRKIPTACLSFPVHGQIRSLLFLRYSLSLRSPRGSIKCAYSRPNGGKYKPCSNVARVTLKGLFPTLCRVYRRHAITSNNRHPTR